MRIPAPQLSLRMFLIAVLGAGGLHYHQIISRMNRLHDLRAQEERLQFAPQDGLLIDVQRLRKELSDYRRALPPDGNVSTLLGNLAVIMHDHEIGAPMIRAGPPATTFGVVQSPVDVEFKGSLESTIALLRGLSAASDSWRLARLSIEHGTDRDPHNLAVSMQILAYGRAPTEGE